MEVVDIIGHCTTIEEMKKITHICEKKVRYKESKKKIQTSLFNPERI